MERTSGSRMLKVLIAGGYDDNDPRVSSIKEFGTRLAESVIEQGHIVLGGCLTTLDQLVAEAAFAFAEKIRVPEPGKRVLSYLLSGETPIHRAGTILKSRLSDWEISGHTFFVPEQIQLADVVILIGGFEGTFRAANWARIAKKPLLPVAVFDGAAAKVFDQESDEFHRRPSSWIEKLEFQELNSLSTDWPQFANKVVSLAERMAHSKSVTVIMSYSKRPDLEDAFESFHDVCKKFGYVCSRVQDSNTVGRIIPQIIRQIEGAAFVIADLSELKNNVFYELGYAEGLKKPVVVTAKAGTELPFDAKDIPTIFWDGQKKLKEDLTEKIRLIAETQGRSDSRT
jgi:hypothetical protein